MRIRTAGGLRTFALAIGLTLLGVSYLFFVTAPIYFPLRAKEGWDLMQVSLPVFLGFLTTSSQYLSSNQEDDFEIGRAASLLIVGLMALYGILNIGLFVTYFVDQWYAPSEEPMTLETLRAMHSATVGILAIGMGLATSLAFQKRKTR